MSKVINILTKGFESPNGSAFLFPLIKYRRLLKMQGVELNFFKKITQKIYECDVLITESKYFSTHWTSNTEAILEQFSHFSENINRVFYFDISDSSGFPHARVLPYVDGYVKNQCLKDKSLYLKPLYGHRLYTDYYHRNAGVVDDNALFSEVVSDPVQLDKIKVGWNSGLADYSVRGPYWMKLYRHFALRSLLSYPKKFIEPEVSRANGVSCRMGIAYDRASVSWQRRQIRDKLRHVLATDKLSRRKYFNELARSRLVISPFGLGEITLKDFEVFLTGGLLIKPDMSHMQTWPDFFQANETMLAFDWSLINLKNCIDEALESQQHCIRLAEQGQAYYRRYIRGPSAGELFSNHFLKLLSTGTPPRHPERAKRVEGSQHRSTLCIKK